MVDVIVRGLDAPAAAGRIYNAIDAGGVTWRDYITDIARLAGAAPPTRRIPVAVARVLAAAMETAWRLARRPGRPLLTREAVQLLASGPPVPITRARAELGYDPIPYHRGPGRRRRYLRGNAMKHARALSIVTVLAALAALAACDSRATASNGAEVGKPGRLSSELESCGATAHCAEGLRCCDQVCKREARSTLGDFHAARGARAGAAGDIDAAIAAYAEALAAYEAEKLTVPPDVDCAYGHALVRARGTKDKAELAARVLHRCVLAIPVAVPLQARPWPAWPSSIRPASIPPKSGGPSSPTCT